MDTNDLIIHFIIKSIILKMKLLILLLSIFIFISCSLCSMEQSVTIKIKSTNVGFDFYGEDGELLLDFTNKKELDLLKYVYEVSLEHREELKKEFK